MAKVSEVLIDIENGQAGNLRKIPIRFVLVNKTVPVGTLARCGKKHIWLMAKFGVCYYLCLLGISVVYSDVLGSLHDTFCYRYHYFVDH